MAYETSATFNARLARYEALKSQRDRALVQLQNWEQERQNLSTNSAVDEQAEVAALRAAFITSIRGVFGI